MEPVQSSGIATGYLLGGKRVGGRAPAGAKLFSMSSRTVLGFTGRPEHEPNHFQHETRPRMVEPNLHSSIRRHDVLLDWDKFICFVRRTSVVTGARRCRGDTKFVRAANAEAIQERDLAT